MYSGEGVQMGNRLRDFTRKIILPRLPDSGVHVMPSKTQEEGWARKSMLKKLGLLFLCWGAFIGYENSSGPESMTNYLHRIERRVGINMKASTRTGKFASLRPMRGGASRRPALQNVHYVQPIPYVQDKQDTQVTSFFTALKGSDLSRMRSLLNTGWVRVNSARYKGYTPLEIATWQGNLKVVKFLLQEQKADPNVRDVYGTTALYYANRTHQTAIAKLLLAAGANSVGAPVALKSG
jgi:hypothetical protein